MRFGVKNCDAIAPSAYHRFLVWDIKRGHPVVRWIDRALNPLMGKSFVLYAEKPRA